MNSGLTGMAGMPGSAAETSAEFLVPEFPIHSEVEQRHEGLKPLSPGEQQLLDAVELRDEAQQFLRRMFNRAIDVEIESCVNPRDAGHIKTVASIIEWEWFAQRGDPLPEGVGLNEYKSSLVPKSTYAALNVHRIRSHIENQALKHSYVTRQVMLREVDTQLKAQEALVSIAKESNTYQFLKAFISDEPQVEDQPLTLAQRQIREAQIEGETRRKYGLSHGDDLRLYPNAMAEIHKGSYRLDDEKMLRDRPQANNARERLQQMIIDGMNDYWAGEDFTPIRAVVKREAEIYTCDENGDELSCLGDYSFDYSYWFSDQIDGDILSAASDIAGIRSIVNSLIWRLADPEYSSWAAEDLLEDAVSDVDIHDVFNWNYKEVAGISTDILLQLREPVVDIVDMRRTYGLTPVWEKDSVESDMAVYDRQGLEREVNTIIGLVSGDKSSVANHLILQGNTPLTTCPTAVEDYDVAVEFNHEQMIHSYRLTGVHTPFVPGFEIVAVDRLAENRKFYYKRADRDPYIGAANVIVEPDAVLSVAVLSDTLGFTALANELRLVDTMNLDDLVRLVINSSDYTFDDRYSIFIHKGSEYIPGAYRKAIDEKGRLQVQCTGAAAFLRFVLHTALPNCQTTTLAGNTIARDGSVTAAQHAQVMLTHEGEKYILDSTPGLPGRRGFRSLFGNSRGELYADRSDTKRHQTQNKDQKIDQKLNSTKTNIENTGLVEDQLEIVEVSADIREKERSANQEGLTDRAKQLMKAHFNLTIDSNDDLLYQRVVSLKKDADPIRRVLELIMQRDGGYDVGEDIERTSTYLENLRKADKGMLRRIGIPKYDDQLITSLQAIVSDLQLPKA